jgi:hypothetical protein
MFTETASSTLHQGFSNDEKLLHNVFKNVKTGGKNFAVQNNG